MNGAWETTRSYGTLDSKPLSKTSNEDSESGILDNASSRTIDLLEVSRDAPLVVLCWLLFAMVFSIFALRGPLVAGFIAFGFGLILSTTLLLLSYQRGFRYACFCVCCLGALLLGLGFGLFVGIKSVNEADRIASIIACICLLPTLLISGLIVSHCVNFRLVGSSEEFAKLNGWGWCPEVVPHMRFGLDMFCGAGLELVEQDVHPLWVAKGFVDGRCYWSGEPALDYMFNVANEHSFLTVLLSHPVNPFEKHERIMLLLIVCSLIVFPVALIEVLLPHNALWPLRMIVGLALVTAPRNLLKFLLKLLVINESHLRFHAVEEHELEKRRRKTLRRRLSIADAQDCMRAEHATFKETMYFSVCLVVTAVICFCCCRVVQLHKRPLGPALYFGCEGLVFAFVLELLFHFVMPQHGHDGTWVLGFFGQWWSQRQYYSDNRTS